MAKSTNEVDQVDVIPNRLDPAWSDYVMSLFHPSELLDGKPLVAGLRRVGELLMGTIVSSKPTLVVPVEGDGLGRATVVYEVQFMSDNGLVTFADVADVWQGNTDSEFLAFAVAVASTRAEARAIRKALKLRVVAAEECAKQVQSAKDESHEDVISHTQINFIDRKCKSLDINAVAFINGGKRTYNSRNEVLNSTATAMIKALNKLDNNRSEITDNIKGYRSDWLEHF